MAIKRPLVVGLGGVGRLVARLLSGLDMQVAGIDRTRPVDLPAAVQCRIADVTDPGVLAEALADRDAVIACLPYHHILLVAQQAHKAGLHYFDPTEDIKTTTAIRQLAKTSRGVMIAQNGLAPGFIGIAAANLAQQFDEGSLRHIKMRVGALPAHPIGQIGLAANWNLQGLVHQYIADCDVIVQGQQKTARALNELEIIRINGAEYQAFTTSGGVGTMTETFAGQVETLNYKTLRYPGHFEAMRLLLKELRFQHNPDALVQFLADALPADDQDRVLIHASVQGNIDGKLQSRTFFADYKPIAIAQHFYTAITWTTAAAIVAVVELVSKGQLPQQGFIKQEDIKLEDFLRTHTGRLYLDNHSTPQLLQARSP